MDQAHEWTDEQLLDLEHRIRSEYTRAYHELRKKRFGWLKEYAEENGKWKDDLKNGKVTQKAYDKWLKEQALKRVWGNTMLAGAYTDMMTTAQKVAEMVNGVMPGVFAENANYTAYTIDKATDIGTGFAMYDQSTVRRLLMEQPKLLPYLSPDPDKVIPHFTAKVRSEVTQGILQGESIPDIAARLKTVVGMEQGASIRAARTAVTGAECAGRADTYRRAEAMGIDIKQEWIATLDTRTRPSHRVAHRQVVDIGQPFEVGSDKLMYPGDPSGHAEEVYNCRCTTIAIVDGIDPADNMSTAKLKKAGLTYDEWKAGKMPGPAGPAAQTGHTIAEGKDMLHSYVHRKDTYKFDIEDIINQQGFDGKPRVVDANEFDKAVKAANGGNGLIMQRSYSASSHEILDGYRNQLYDGKWYVDCSEGGSVYGQGMYAASDWTGKLSDSITGEMKRYTNIGTSKHPLSSEEKADVRARRDAEIASIKNDDRFRLTPEEKLAMRWDMDSEDFPERVEWEKSGRLAELIESIDDKSSARAGLKDRLMNMNDYELADRYGMGHTYIETMTLDPSAKVVNYRDVRKMLLKDEFELPDGRMAGELDLGAYAAALGYDAINVVDAGGGCDYTVILNRTKCIIRRS